MAQLNYSQQLKLRMLEFGMTDELEEKIKHCMREYSVDEETWNLFMEWIINWNILKETEYYKTKK